MIDKPFLGGGQITVLNLAHYLDKKKFEVFVSSEEGGPLVEEAQKAGISHLPVRIKKGLSFKTVAQMASFFHEHRIDILHTHGGIAGFFGRWAARKAKVPFIVHTFHGIHYLHYRNPFQKWAYIFLERVFSRFTQACIFVCESDFKKAQKHKLVPLQKMHLVRNGLDFSRLEKVENAEKKREELGLVLFQPLVGTVARLHRQKGIVYLIRATKEILEKFPRAKILIIGGGPLRKKLEGEAIKRGVGEAVMFLGERKDATAILSLFNVFVLPSLWEGLPYAVLEAATLGKPIVASCVDGIKEVIDHGDTGLLVSPGKETELAQAVMLLLHDRNLASRLAERARAEIPSRFSLRRMLEQTQNLYLSIWAHKA